jgi:SAM-dependent methyltransferase
MSVSLDNQRGYESTGIVQGFLKDLALQPAEAMIFLQYSDHIKGRDVLDIGCGVGRTTRYLAPLAKHYAGCDYAATMVETCRALFPAVDIRQGDARYLQAYADASMDFVLFSYNGIDSVDHQGRLHVLAEAHRVLRPGGLFVFSSHNKATMTDNLHPAFTWSKSPCRLLSNLKLWGLSWRNYLQHRKRHRFETDYMQITDPFGAYSILNYYIDPPTQARQAASAGFDMLAAYDAQDGRLLASGDAAVSAIHVYYVLAKPH